MDQQRKFLKDLIREHDQREAPLSLRIGQNRAYLNQYFKRGAPKELPEDVREALGQEFQLHPDSFKHGRRIELPKLGTVRLLKSEKVLGRVVASGAALVNGRTTVLEFQLTGETPTLVVEVDRQAVAQLRENLDALETILGRAD
jgi:hypothetical protein